jgi:ABC-type oligopeptide transport system substrate-binding subunit
VLVPNPNYYGFKPKLSKIIYNIGSDRDSNYKAFQAGQYDAAPVPPALEAVAAKKPGFQQVPALASRFIEMNWLVKPLDNVHVRQALDLAINKDLIINHVIGPNIVTPSNHIVPKGIPGYNDKLTGPGGVAGTAGADTITSIVAEWKSVLGITVKTVGVQPNQLLDDEANTLGKPTLQMWYGVWGADYPDPQDWLSNFFANGGQDNFANYGQNNSAAASEQQAVQAELAKADGDQNQAERLQLYQDAEQKIVNDVGWIVTYQSSYGYAVNPKLHGWHLNPLGSIATDDWADIYFVQ